MDNSPSGMVLSAWFAQRTPGEESCRLPIGVHTKHAMRGWRRGAHEACYEGMAALLCIRWSCGILCPLSPMGFGGSVFFSQAVN